MNGILYLHTLVNDSIGKKRKEMLREEGGSVGNKTQ